MWLGLAMVVGCSPPRLDHTRLGSGDLVAMTGEMAESLAGSEALAGRDSESAAWTITLDRVTNYTNDIIPDRQKWAYMSRLRARLSESTLPAERNLGFVLPRAWAEALGERHEDVGGERRTPTHALAATFYSLTQYNRAARTDTYLCVFELMDLRDDRVLWEDSWEVKRGVVRNEFD